jgi:hypothetical protein
LEMVKVDMFDNVDGVGWDDMEEVSRTISGKDNSHGLFVRDMRIFSGAQLCCPVIDGQISRWIQMRWRRGKSQWTVDVEAMMMRWAKRVQMGLVVQNHQRSLM